MNAPATQQRALVPIEEVRAQLTLMEPQFALALPEHVSPQKFVRVVTTAVQGNPDLLKADRKSLFAAAMKCAQDGLLPDGREAALVVYGSTVSYLPMIAGVLSKVRRSGELLSIAAHVVYENDTFAYVLGDDERIEHEPLMTGQRGKPMAVYAVAKTKDGGIYREVMTIDQVEQVRKVSRAATRGPWVQWWDEMARKTVIRRLSKRLPMSTDLAEVLQRDDDHYDIGAADRAPRTPNTRRLHAGFDDPNPQSAPQAEEVIEGEFTDTHGETAASDDLGGVATAAVEEGSSESPEAGFDVLAWADRLEASLPDYAGVDVMRTDWDEHKVALQAADPALFKRVNLAIARRATELAGK